MDRMSARLTLESPVRTPDGGGGVTLAWVEAGHIWGAVEPRRVTERASGDRLASRISHRITIRREPGADRRPRADQRLRMGDRIFRVLGAADGDPQAATLTLWVEEGPYS